MDLELLVLVSPEAWEAMAHQNSPMALELVKPRLEQHLQLPDKTSSTQQREARNLVLQEVSAQVKPEQHLRQQVTVMSIRLQGRQISHQLELSPPARAL